MMKITNHYNLPRPIFDKIAGGVYDPEETRIGVTTLIDAPLKRHLKIKHWDTLEEDASERLWALLGTAVHYILEGHDNALTEERLEYQHPCGLLLVGYQDIYQNKTVRDYKCTSVWSYIYGKDSWNTQINTNAELLERYGFEVKAGAIDLILRDWQKSKAGQDNYPPIPFATVNIPIWTPEERNRYIDGRMELHTCQDVPPCTPEEMWESPTTYAVKGKSRKTAFRVLDTFELAEQWISENGKGDFIEKRDGERRCCKEYCSVRSVCPYNIYREMSNEETK